MSKHKSTDLELYYQNISEVYLAEIQDFQEPYVRILTAKGALVEMESDIVAFLKKSKETDRTKKQQERISVLGSVVDYFDNMASTMYQMRLLLRRANRHLDKEKKEHEETKRALDMVTAMLNEE